MQTTSIQYHDYFGLDDQAFSIAVNPRYLYMSEQHREALAHLLFGVKSGGFVMLSGEVGTGKTTIIRCLLEQLPDNADLAIVMNPSASARDLLCSICDEFKVPYVHNETSIKVLTDKLTEFLVSNHVRGRKSIVLIDEAQLLRISTLEQVRLLTNLETNTQKLLQIILVGQPELNDLLAKPALRQLSQRITARYHLRPLTETDTAAYIKHRLKIAGLPPARNPFPPKIVRRVHAVSRGIPRLINILCDRMLLGVYSKEGTHVDMDICKQAVVEVMGAAPQEIMVDQNQKYFYAGAGVAAVVVLAMVGWWFLPARPLAPQADSPTAQPVTAAVSAPAAEETIPVAQKPMQSLPESEASTDYLFRQQDKALELLMAKLELGKVRGVSACWTASQKGYQCETHTVDTWEDFSVYNRPAVLTVRTEAKRKAFVPLVGLALDHAWVLTEAGVRKIDLLSLGQQWTGEFTYIWAKPTNYEKTVGVGSQTPLVAWVARQFALMDNQQEPLANSLFNDALKQRVKIFQRSVGLEDDGFVGQQTLLKLNEVMGYDVALTDFEANAYEISGHPQLP